MTAAEATAAMAAIGAMMDGEVGHGETIAGWRSKYVRGLVELPAFEAAVGRILAREEHAARSVRPTRVSCIAACRCHRDTADVPAQRDDAHWGVARELRDPRNRSLAI